MIKFAGSRQSLETNSICHRPRFRSAGPQSTPSPGHPNRRSGCQPVAVWQVLQKEPGSEPIEWTGVMDRRGDRPLHHFPLWGPLTERASSPMATSEHRRPMSPNGPIGDRALHRITSIPVGPAPRAGRYPHGRSSNTGVPCASTGLKRTRGHGDAERVRRNSNGRPLDIAVP